MYQNMQQIKKSRQHLHLIRSQKQIPCYQIYMVNPLVQNSNFLEADLKLLVDVLAA